MDNQYQGRSINRIKECMQHGVVREYVLTELEKDKILTVTDGRVSPYKKFDKYAWLDD